MSSQVDRSDSIGRRTQISRIIRAKALQVHNHRLYVLWNLGCERQVSSVASRSLGLKRQFNSRGPCLPALAPILTVGG